MEYVLLVYHGKDFAEYHLPRMKNDYYKNEIWRSKRRIVKLRFYTF